jgi:tRNA1Val (adenine37-N6)-methyltransferase
MKKGFQFKQFYISQDRAAMKVSETACLLGVFMPLNGKEQAILDIGAGTGVLSLMLAQRSLAPITAIEIDPDATQQARENVINSSFSNRIDVQEADLISWMPTRQFDAIVCNPPFFENQLASANPKKKIAWHSSRLTLLQLITKANECLTPQGQIGLLLPYQRMNEIEHIGTQLGLSVAYRYTLQHAEDHPIKYVIIGLSKSANKLCHEQRLVIRQADRHYTKVVFKRLQPFYKSL